MTTKMRCRRCKLFRIRSPSLMRRSVMRMGMGGQVRSPFFLLEVDFDVGFCEFRCLPTHTTSYQARPLLMRSDPHKVSTSPPPTTTTDQHGIGKDRCGGKDPLVEALSVPARCLSICWCYFVCLGEQPTAQQQHQHCGTCHRCGFTICPPVSWWRL